MAKQRDQQERRDVMTPMGPLPAQAATQIGEPLIVVRQGDDSVDVHTLARDLFISAAPSHRGSGRTEEQLARECYVFARAFLKVRAEQQQLQDAREPMR